MLMLVAYGCQEEEDTEKKKVWTGRNKSGCLEAAPCLLMSGLFGGSRTGRLRRSDGAARANRSASLASVQLIDLQWSFTAK